jgi:predicted nucleic acid-binding protein
MSVKPFFDTNILVYAFSQEDPRSEVARILLVTGGVISVQVLNELTSVLRHKLKLSWKEILEALGAVRTLCPTVCPLTVDTHEKALQIVEQYGYRIYDSLIIAAALAAKTTTLYSEDMSDGQVIENVLTIKNPFQNKK